MRALIFVYIIKKVTQALAQNTPLEWFSSRPRLRVVLRLLNEISWLHIRTLVSTVILPWILLAYIKKKKRNLLDIKS